LEDNRIVCIATLTANGPQGRNASFKAVARPTLPIPRNLVHPTPVGRLGFGNGLLMAAAKTDSQVASGVESTICGRILAAEPGLIRLSWRPIIRPLW
jgi:hypothetical protein